MRNLYRCVIFLRDQCRVGLFKTHNGIVQICPTPQQLFAALDNLAAADPETLLRKVKSALASEEFRVPAGYTFNLKKIRDWIAAAKDLI